MAIGQAGMIAAYLRELSDALRFDPPLARSIVAEVRDHLDEAAAAEPVDDRQEAERRAIAKFGSAHELAVQFAAVSLARRNRRLGIASILSIVAVMLMMKARVAWYVIAQWTISDDARMVAKVILTVDRYAFWLSAIIGIGALVKIARYRTPVTLHEGYRRHLHWSLILLNCATGFLLVSVGGDLVLTALQTRMGWNGESIIPIMSLVMEIACVIGIAVLMFESKARMIQTETILQS
jgi:hypothetical protein